MTKETIIPAGYRLTVVSWENDGDNYNTKVLEGLSRDRVEYFVDLCKMTTRCGYGNYKGMWPEIPDFGNMYEPNDEELQKFSKFVFGVLYNHLPWKETGDDAPLTEEDAQYYVSEDLYDLGLSGSEGFFTRVCDEFKVEFIKEPILLNDVTEEFK
jgi:hypothetical protein